LPLILLERGRLSALQPQLNFNGEQLAEQPVTLGRLDAVR
jgi:hypothetical protein